MTGNRPTNPPLNPPLRLIDTEADGSSRTKTAAEERDGLALASLDRISFWLLVLALLLAPLGAGLFATLPMGSLPPQGMISWLQTLGIPILSIIVALALAVSVAREWQRPVAIGPVGGLAGGALGMAVWAGVSLLVHPPVTHAGLNVWTGLLAVLAVGGLTSRLGRDRKALMTLLLIVAAAGSFAAAFGVSEYLTYWKNNDASHRVFGTFINPDFLAGYLLLTIPLTLACFVSGKERNAKLLLGLGLMLQTACLLFTSSRAGVAMLFVALIGWLLLMAWAGVMQGRGRQLAGGLALVVLAAVLGSTPLLIRLTNTGKQAGAGGPKVEVSQLGAAADTQAHSGKFRQYTWMGTMRMARANLLAGTGIGSYETNYTRYATTAYTAHAHNSFLQWMAETGAPGVLSLLVVLASSTAFAMYVLFLNPTRSTKNRQNTKRQNGDEIAEPADENDLVLSPPLSRAPASPLPFGFAEPRLLLTGLITAIVCSTLHSLFDSDWYIVATAVTLSAILGLMIALARDVAPLATQKPRPLAKGMLAACAAVALLLAWRGGATYLSRMSEAQGLESFAAFQEQAARQDSGARVSLQNAIDSHQSAVVFDPFNPEPLLMLSNLYRVMGDTTKTLQALEQAVRIAPSGKTYYNLGQYRKRQAVADADGQASGQANDDPIALSGTKIAPSAVGSAGVKQALDAFLHTRDLDPHNLQNLRALAETYALSGNQPDAMQTYRDMTALETTPLGTVRAMPELIESDFAYAHARLANALFSQNHVADAVGEYEKADTLLKTYWDHRSYGVYQVLSKDKRDSLNALYDSVLTDWQTALRDGGSMMASMTARVAAEQEKFHAERRQDEEAAAKAEAESKAKEQDGAAK